MEYIEQLIALICEHFGIKGDDIDDETLLSPLGINRFDETDFFLVADDHFGIELTDDDVESAETIGDLAGIIGKRMTIKSDYE